MEVLQPLNHTQSVTTIVIPTCESFQGSLDLEWHGSHLRNVYWGLQVREDIVTNLKHEIQLSSLIRNKAIA